jgi:hypothetical protein
MGFRPEARGCERRATLGDPCLKAPTPTGLRPPFPATGHSPVGVYCCRAGVVLTFDTLVPASRSQRATVAALCSSRRLPHLARLGQSVQRG